MTANIPEGMSTVNAFDALYQNAQVIGKGSLNVAAGEKPGSPWNAVQIFKSYCNNDYCYYVRGKMIKVYFDPSSRKLDTAQYDKQYGEGAAQRALNGYSREKLDPKDAYHLNCKPCEYFTAEWLEKTPEKDRKDLGDMFEKCNPVQEEVIVKEKKSALFDQCKASYTLHSPPVNYIGHNDKPCEAALDHMKMLLRYSHDCTVQGLAIYSHNTILPFFKSKTKVYEEVTLERAKNILEKEIG